MRQFAAPPGLLQQAHGPFWKSVLPPDKMIDWSNLMSVPPDMSEFDVSNVDWVFAVPPDTPQQPNGSF